MGFVDKIKNALFEEVEEEVEEKPEKPKKEKVKKNSVRDKLIRREKEKAKEREKAKEKPEKPIAQKVVLDDTMDERVDYHELRDEDFDIKPLQDEEEVEEKEEEQVESKPTFTVIDESDLIVDDYVEEKPLIETSNNEKKENFDYYEENKPYGINKDNNIKMHEYGAIAKQEEKSIFRPSPIISPIYGILDKNYKKEDIVNKKDVLITSSYDRRRLSVDDVRKKAYGTISDDLVDDMDKDVPTKEVKEEEKKDDDNVLVDLSDDNKKPTVDEVTMGDAEEYYDDLGLEYNVDYVDSAKGKHVKETKEEEKESKVEEKPKKEKKAEEKKVEEKKESKEKEDTIDDDDDNLFDLIDSMYQEKE